MSKQLYMYALPTDIQRVIAQLSEKLGVTMLSPTSPSSEPTWISSPILNRSLLPTPGSTSVNCYLVQSGLAQVRLDYYASLSSWHISDDSEVIAATGCDFDGKVLVRGRLYCQTDMLRGQEIIPKRLEFIRWTERVYRLVKKNLHMSEEFGAYVGPDALEWEKAGGCFASSVLPGQKMILASRRRTIRRVAQI